MPDFGLRRTCRAIHGITGSFWKWDKVCDGRGWRLTMTPRKPCPPVPGPLEAYAQGFDDLFGQLAQRRGFREYLLGLSLPRDHKKT